MLWCLWCWCVIGKLHQSASLNFMVTGRTKFAADWCFGLLKQRYRRSEVSMLSDNWSIQEIEIWCGQDCLGVFRVLLCSVYHYTAFLIRHSRTQVHAVSGVEWSVFFSYCSGSMTLSEGKTLITVTITVTWCGSDHVLLNCRKISYLKLKN